MRNGQPSEGLSSRLAFLLPAVETVRHFRTWPAAARPCLGRPTVAEHEARTRPSCTGCPLAKHTCTIGQAHARTREPNTMTPAKIAGAPLIGTPSFTVAEFVLRK